ncbi:MAG: ferredoxin [Candidatus Aegiribacteria sp.]
MAIKKVWIEDGCTVCGLCADECPAVFKMEDTTAAVREEAALDVNEECIESAAEKCPVDVIKYE